jgi:hypothetical protein
MQAAAPSKDRLAPRHSARILTHLKLPRRFSFRRRRRRFREKFWEEAESRSHSEKLGEKFLSRWIVGHGNGKKVSRIAFETRQRRFACKPKFRREISDPE